MVSCARDDILLMLIAAAEKQLLPWRCSVWETLIPADQSIHQHSHGKNLNRNAVTYDCMPGLSTTPLSHMHQRPTAANPKSALRPPPSGNDRHTQLPPRGYGLGMLRWARAYSAHSMRHCQL
eukprot:202061-Chlamydomonas_euryale.AAC.3